MIFVDAEINDFNFKMRSVLFFDEAFESGMSNMFIYGTIRFK